MGGGEGRYEGEECAEWDFAVLIEGVWPEAPTG